MLENDLQSKISSYADKESEYVQKWDDLQRDQQNFESERAEETKNLESLRKEASDEFTKVKAERAKVQEKERRLDEERKNARQQSESVASKHQGELQRVRSQEMTKLLIASGLCFVIGIAVALFLSKSQ